MIQHKISTGLLTDSVGTQEPPQMFILKIENVPQNPIFEWVPEPCPPISENTRGSMDPWGLYMYNIGGNLMQLLSF